MVLNNKQKKRMKDLVLTSLTRQDLENIVIDCVNACLKHNATLSKVESYVESKESDQVLLTISKSAATLDVSESTIRWYIETGLLDTVRVGRTGRGVRIRYESLQKLAEHLSKKKQRK